MRTDRQLQDWLALHVTTEELRRFAYLEFPALFPALPASSSPPVQVAFELFRLASHHGCSAELRANLNRWWPGMIGPHPRPYDDLPQPRSHRPSPSSPALRGLSLVFFALLSPSRSEAAAEREVALSSGWVSPHDADTTGRSIDRPSTTGSASGESSAASDATGPVVPAAKKPAGTQPPAKKPAVAKPLQPLSTLEGVVEEALLACTRGEAWDIEVEVAADHEGRWSTAHGLDLSSQMSKCVGDALKKAMRRESRRFTAGTSLRFTVHLR
jgi:hypothetical protein